MTTIIDRARRAAVHHAGPTRVAALLLVALLALTLTGCWEGSNGTDQLPRPSASNHYAPPYDPNDYVDETGDYTDGDSGDYTDDSGSRTNPCAFPGDPLCPDEPIKVPPPNLDPW